MNMTPILTFGCGLSQNRYGSWIKNSVNRSQKLCERKAYGPSHIQSIQRAPRDTMKCSSSQLEKQINRYGSQHMQLPYGFQSDGGRGLFPAMNQKTLLEETDICLY